MFKKFTDKIITDAKETVKEEIQVNIDKQLPFILGVIAMGITLLSFIQSNKPKMEGKSVTIVTNYYIYGGMK